MRADIYKIDVEDYKFVLEIDTGGDPEYPYTLWIYDNNGKQVNYYNEDKQARKDFSKNYSKVYLKNFCNKFANDADYRNGFLNQKTNKNTANK